MSFVTTFQARVDTMDRKTAERNFKERQALIDVQRMLLDEGERTLHAICYELTLNCPCGQDSVKSDQQSDSNPAPVMAKAWSLGWRFPRSVDGQLEPRCPDCVAKNRRVAARNPAAIEFFKL